MGRTGGPKRGQYLNPGERHLGRKLREEKDTWPKEAEGAGSPCERKRGGNQGRPGLGDKTQDLQLTSLLNSLGVRDSISL